ncbi:MAG: YicC/YloC family endoribonuclease, partial [Bacteroidales bacterium]
MTQSMTGYGKAETVLDEKKIIVELRSVNSKQLDISLRTPSLFREFEPEIRRLLGVLQRGKIECSISFEKNNPIKTIINETVFKAYYTQLQKISRDLGNASVPLGDILRL